MTQLLTQQQVAERLAVSVRTVRDLPLRTVRLGRLVRYREADVEAYIAKRAEQPRKGAA